MRKNELVILVISIFGALYSGIIALDTAVFVRIFDRDYWISFILFLAIAILSKCGRG
ncbi:hypothetical protein HY491_00850 [Candidatus Woesearchaeota archaeon]|nr:hypothetical protein [Candidatus Woesearchaeota archaeon]